MSSQDVIAQILDKARWAPSGDNTQPWRFEVLGDLQVRVHGFDTRDHCVYDLDGHPSQISIGALLETAAIAASHHGLEMRSTRRPDSTEERPVFDLQFLPDPALAADPLYASIERRSVQRRPLSMQALTAEQRQTLEAAIGPAYSIAWIDDFDARFRMAKLLFHSAKLRLVMPEAYQVHKDIIEWNAQFSTERVPDQALGADPLTTRLMQFVMHSWSRVEVFNRFFAGTWAPRIQLDFIPGLACAAHFLLLARHPAQTIDDYVAAGRAVQRFWLTATHLALQLQPEVTPLVFSRYARGNVPFSRKPGLDALARRIDQRFAELVGTDAAAHAVFMGRVGTGKPASARSLRRPLADLMLPAKG
ncbi:nitroreductase family protein [Roseateles violae]|uniref:Nitroreductase family protein n=1 Tax=Roseateles violae TaxID=3058042 RepID=A0ABT8DQ13_9BURK|nr:nitroreductase family protein [Pelomonas sp. PFR6]MDN3920440.1 nitroreductase family protein [Pelomonas sp. PFR6]